MSRYVFDINQPAGLFNPSGGESGGSLLYGLNNNFEELYKGSGNIYSIQAEDEIGSASWWADKLLSFTTFAIINNFDFGGVTLTLPEGVVLIFNGGIWSNGTIIGNNTSIGSYGIRQCFETDLTLSGTWLIDYITPQHYGAKTNANPTIIANECSAAIQKCVDSIFSVFLPSGYYYITSAIIVSTPKTITCIRGANRYTTYKLDHTRIYTDQDIDIFIVRSHDVCIFGYPVFDTQLCTVNTGASLRLDLNYALYNIDFEINIQGNETALVNEANGIIGVYFDQDHLLHAGGYCSWMKFKGTLIGVKYGVYVPLSTPGVFTWNNYFNIDINIDCSKQAFRCLGEFSVGWFKMMHQSRYVLTATEFASDLVYAMYHCADSCVFDIFTFDLSDSPYNGLYTNAHSVWDFGGNNNYIGLSNLSYSLMKSPETQEMNSIKGLINSRNLLLNVQKIKGGPAISYFDNELAYLYKKSSYTVNCYDGTGYDFDTNLDPSIGLPAEPSLTISDPNTIFDLRAFPTQVAFTNPAKYDTGFVEIVFPYSRRFRYISYFIDERFSRFQRIQTIVIENNGTHYQHNIITNKFDFGAGQIARNNYITDGSLPYLIEPATIIIRFIGYVLKELAAYNIPVQIIDIYLQELYTTESPMIDIGGGQTIYGNIAINDGVKEVDLPVYADNAAAKVGGLVAGDPYRTATGVRMVVYD